MSDKDKLQLLIHTHGRKNDQLTVQCLGKELMDRTTIICPQKEYNTIRYLRDDFNVVAQPNDEWKLPEKRDWTLKHWHEMGYTKIMLLDDDLRFATRVSDDDWHLREIKGQELLDEFLRLEEKLGPEYPHVGFGIRQGNNNIKDPGWRIATKQVCTLGYYVPIVVKEVRWDNLILRTDFSATLQLLLKGYPNAIWDRTVADQKEFDAPGGCSRYRTLELLNEQAEVFASLYPGYVSLTKREYNEKTKDKGSKRKETATRIETVIQWQKAYEEGRNVRNQGEQHSGRASASG
jgi:hypothetical protein